METIKNGSMEVSSTEGSLRVSAEEEISTYRGCEGICERIWERICQQFYERLLEQTVLQMHHCRQWRGGTSCIRHNSTRHITLSYRYSLGGGRSRGSILPKLQQKT